MNRSFVFEVDNPAEKTKTKKAASQSPWEFSGYADAVEVEHQKRQTSSVDHKISRLKVQKGLSKKKSKKRRHEESEENEELLADSTNKKRKKRKAPDSENADSDPEENESSEVSGESEGEHGSESPSEEYVDDTAEVPKEPEKLAKNRKSKKANGAAENAKKDVRKMKSFFSSCEGATFISKSFVDLNISRPLIRACEALGYKDPTPIQTACIPLALTGRDICGSAVTGSGKTAAFALPLLERLLFRPRRISAIRVLILTPTRELAVQLHSMIEKLAQYTDIRCCAIVGGLSSKLQETALRTHPDIVIATPGRMLDHLQNSHSVGLEELAILVLDEADRLLELGFQEEVHELVRLCPKKRQTMLFSATMTEEVDELIKLSLNSPVRLSADPLTKRPATLLEEVIKMKPSHEPDREAILLSLCSRSFSSKVIIFSGTKVEAHRLKIIFGLSGLKAAELHGNLTQVQRLSALESFRKQEVDFLIATDVAARGLDIIGVESVINFQCPPDITMYVHRVGRTARAGRQGCAVTFMSGKDRPLLKAMVKRIGGKLQNRIVSPASIAHWRTKLEGMEEDIVAIISEEREERALRKAEMEMNKAQNMMEHEAEIYSRPKKTWFQSSKEKKLTANQSKEPREESEKGAPKKKITSVLEAKKSAKDLKAQLEREKRLPRKKRRRLQAAREAAVEDEEEDNDVSPEDSTKVRARSTHSKKSVKDGGKTLVEVGYRRAKAAKAEMKAREAGKVARGSEQLRKKSKAPNRRAADLNEAMPEATSSKSSRFVKMAGFKKKKLGVSKKAFKSKSRYKRRK